MFARAGIHGDTLVWRDIVCEGPVAAAGLDLDDRAAYLARALDVDADEYRAVWRDAHAALTRAGDYDEVVLWFEQDLFCAANLWYLLTRLSDHATPVTLVYPSLDEVNGLGAAGPEALAKLFTARAALHAAARHAARAAWQAYASPTPEAADLLSRTGEGPLPFVAPALRRHLARLPALATGLNEIEAAALDELDAGPLMFPGLFSAVTSREPIRRHGMGDVQLAAALRDLAGGPNALVTINAGAQAVSRDWQLRITAAGRSARAGAAPWRPPARFIGGVHLHGAGAGWRRDAERIVRVSFPAS